MVFYKVYNIYMRNWNLNPCIILNIFRYDGFTPDNPWTNDKYFSRNIVSQADVKALECINQLIILR